MRHSVAGFFVGASWISWVCQGAPSLGTALLLLVVLMGLLWPELTRVWKEWMT